MRALLFPIVTFLTLNLIAQESETSYFLEFNKTQDILQEKNFYLFSSIQQNSHVDNLLRKNKVLQEIAQKRYTKIKHSLSNNNPDINMLVKAYYLSPQDIQAVSVELKSLLKNEKVLTDWVNHSLRPSKAYARFEHLPDAEYLTKSWELCANAMNHILDVYGLGEKPMYPKIDSISYDVHSSFFKGSIYFWSDALFLHSNWKNALFYQNTLDFSLALLYMNHRDEAARYEPMELRENKSAVENIRNIDFSQYKYAAIVVLGNGPENYRDRLTALGKLNLLLGVIEYRSGKAPLIIVSGGHAHPYRAPFAEAIEMKKELMERFHIPEEHIIIDPHARHTTTNLRNASRLIKQYGIPFNKKCLAVSHNSHIDYVNSEVFHERCLKELGYLPVLLQERISATAIEFVPQIESGQQNPIEPLDP